MNQLCAPLLLKFSWQIGSRASIPQVMNRNLTNIESMDLLDPMKCWENTILDHFSASKSHTGSHPRENHRNRSQHSYIAETIQMALRFFVKTTIEVILQFIVFWIFLMRVFIGILLCTFCCLVRPHWVPAPPPPPAYILPPDSKPQPNDAHSLMPDTWSNYIRIKGRHSAFDNSMDKNYTLQLEL